MFCLQGPRYGTVMWTATCCIRYIIQGVLSDVPNIFGKLLEIIAVRRFNECWYDDYNASVNICGGQNIEHLRFHMSILTVRRRKVYVFHVLLQMLRMPSVGTNTRVGAKTQRCYPTPHIWYQSRILHPVHELQLLLFVYNCGSVDQTLRGPPQVKAYRLKFRWPWWPWHNAWRPRRIRHPVYFVHTQL